MQYAEVVIEAGVNVVCRDEAFWLTESDWCFKKVFHTVFDVLVTHEVFLSLTVFAFEGKENALLFCHNLQPFFIQAAIILRTNFCELVHRKTFVLPTDCCFWKKDLKWKLKEDEIIGGKKESYFRRLFGLLHGKQEISKVLYSFFVWTMKSVERVSQSISVKWKQSSSSEKKH